MKNVNNNISSMFDNMNKSNPINYSEYKMVKSGSYKKLLKAAYAEKAGEEKAKTENASKTQKNAPKTDDTGFTKLKGDAEMLAKDAGFLETTKMWEGSDGSLDKDKITSAIKDFVKGYNAVTEEAKTIKSKEVTNNANWMQGLTNTMSKTLAKAGITVGKDNKLSFDEEAFKKGDMKAAKSLFAGEHTYASEIKDKANSIASAVVMNTSLYKNDGSAQSVLAGLINQGI